MTVLIKEAAHAGLGCGHCDSGFRRIEGIHIGSQRLGMIPNAPCERVFVIYEGGNAKPWAARVDGEILRKKSGDTCRFTTAESAYRAACKAAPRR